MLRNTRAITELRQAEVAVGTAAHLQRPVAHGHCVRRVHNVPACAQRALSCRERREFA